MFEKKIITGSVYFASIRPFFISKFKFSVGNQPVGKVWLKIYVQFYFGGMTLRTFARKFSSRWIFLKFLLRTDNELLVSEIQKKVGVTDFVSEIKSEENYPDFEKLAHVISHDLGDILTE